MPIKFTCSGCGQVLRVGDEAAGKRAKCPKCQNVVVIPAPDLIPLEPPAEVEEWSQFSDSPWGGDTSNPYLAPAAPAYLPPVPAVKSPFGGGKIVNVPADIGTILNYATKVWTDNLGLLVGAFLVWACISGGISFASNMVMRVMAEADQSAAIAVIALMAALGRFIVDTFLTAGYWLMLLKMARRQRVEFNDLFSGGPVFLPAMGVSILYGFAVTLGFLLLIVPGILVLLFWWPCYYLVIDRKASVMESFSLAREVTANNIGTTFLMGLLSIGIAGLGLLACCVGIVVAFPLSALVTTVGYLMMSGQLPLDGAQRSYK